MMISAGSMLSLSADVNWCVTYFYSSELTAPAEEPRFKVPEVDANASPGLMENRREPAQFKFRR